MSDFIVIFISMLVTFILGFGAMLLLAGKLPLHYLFVKMGRGKKILIFADTPTGRKSYVGKIEGDVKEGIVSWDYNGSPKMTELKGKNEGIELVNSDGTKTKISADNVGRFFGVFYMAVNVEAPMKPYNLSILGEIPHSSIDLPTFQNLFNRAMTRPSMETDQVLKLIKIILIAVVILALIMIFLFLKVGGIQQSINALAVL